MPSFTPTQASRMLGNEAVLETARQCQRILDAAGIPTAVVGGIAVMLHGYQRYTLDADFLIEQKDQETIRTALQNAGFEWDEQKREFRSPLGVAVQFVIAGHPAGKGSEVRLPSPANEANVSVIDGIRSLNLARLIESKIACGEGNLRRTHKDLADVVELIDSNQLSHSFGRKLHRSLRPTFKQLVKRVRDE